ncbi:hypothetical protein [Streptomyces noursei]|uniref:hypothetical protein n=1 Tax=Streptomyces noursei TaxID=1971 RepID=UPI00380BD252
MSIDAPRPSGRSPCGGPRPASDPPRPYTPLWRRLREDEWPPLGEVLRGRREQMSPGVLLVLLLPCLWWLTVPLMVGYQLARTARRMARRVFPVRPEGHVEDPEVLRVQRVRAWAALVMSGGGAVGRVLVGDPPAAAAARGAVAGLGRIHVRWVQRQGSAEPRRAALVGQQCPVAARMSVFDVDHYGVTEAAGEPLTAGRTRTAA